MGTRRKKARRTHTFGLGGLALVLALGGGTAVVLVQPEPVEACTVRSGYDGRNRNCTLTEALSRCLQEANDAYWRCRGPRPGWWKRIRCEIMASVDQAGCLVGSPLIAMGRPIFGP